MKGIFVTKIIAALAGVSVAATVALGTTSSAHASLPAPTEAVTATAMQAAPPAESVFKQFKWPTLEKGESGEIGVRFKPRGGSTLPTGKGIDLIITAPPGAAFVDGNVRFTDQLGYDRTVSGEIRDDGKSLVVSDPDLRVSKAFGMEVRFALHAVAPVDGAHWGNIAVSGGEAFGRTSQSFKYVGVSPDVASFEVTSPSAGSVVKDAYVLFDGYGAPGADVSVQLQSSDGKCDATVAADGTWECGLDRWLDSGSHQATVTQKLATGSIESLTVGFIVHVPHALVSTGPSGTVGSTPVITGEGIPGRPVKATVVGDMETFIIEGTVRSNGIWSITPSDPLPAGEYKGRVEYSDEIGTMVPLQRFTVDPELD